MNKYYMIPLKSFSTKIHDIRLDDFLKSRYPSLYNAINDVKIYSDIEDSDDLEEQNDKEYFERYMLETLDHLDLPYYILAKNNDSGIKEAETEEPIKIDGISEDNYQCSKETFEKYYNEEYSNKIVNLFTLTEELIQEENEKKTI